MGPSQAEREIQQLRDALKQQEVARQVAENEAHRAKNEAHVAKQELSLLQSSLGHSQPQLPLSPSLSSPSNPNVPSPTYHAFNLSNASPTTNPFQPQESTSRRHSIQQLVPRAATHGQSPPTARHYQPSPPQTSIRQHNGSQHEHAVKRQRTMSEQVPAAHQMNRSHSNLSTRSAGPFSGDAPVSPLSKANSANIQVNGGMWDCTNADEPAPAYTAGHVMNRSQSTRLRRRSDLVNMPTVTESESVLMDPHMFFAMHAADPTVSSYLSTDVSHFHVSNMSACGSMTSAPTVETTDMTRQNSNAFDSQSVGHGMHMLKLGSQQGHAVDMSQLDSPLYYATSGDDSPLGKRTASSEEDLMAVGSSLAPPFAQPYATSAPSDGLLTSHDMSRSASNTSMASNRSSSSLKARAKESLQRQNMRSINTPLKPKPSVDHKAAESQPSAKKDGKTAISKTKYVRPRQPKVYCEQCDEHKEGFRGEHELRRHRDAKHPDQGVVRKWICIDPTTAGLPISIPVVNSLDKCKACKAGKKYGAYYNAAAHLRRTHFKEKPSRAKNKNAGGNNSRSDDDKRGGKGGGDWPPMPELKNWMQEVWVGKDEVRADEDEENEDDGAAERGQSDMELDLEQDLIPRHSGYNLPADNSPDNIMSEMDFGFHHPGTLAINTDILPVYHSQLHIPISSAHFTDFVGSPTSPSFVPYLVHGGQMPQYGSVVSSSETVTPRAMTNFTDAMNGNLDDMQFNEIMYPQ